MRETFARVVSTTVSNVDCRAEILRLPQVARIIPLQHVRVFFEGDAMSFKMDRVHVWGVEVKDEPGGVANKLSLLDGAGADLEYVYTQRHGDRPGVGTLCVAPIVGLEQVKAAKAVGLKEVSEPIVMRVEGDNTAGLAHRLKHAWAGAGINLHGAILTVIGSKFVGYVTFDSVADANRAATILADVGYAKVPAGTR